MTDFLESSTLHECAFGLVDAAMIDVLPDGVTNTILAPKGLASSAHLMPGLIDLRQLSSEGCDALFACVRSAYKNSEYPPVAFFITAHTSADEFVRHWNATQIVQLQSKRKLWLRAHDPRVLHQLLRILNPVQRRRLFGRAQEFHYWIGGRWVTAGRDSELRPGDQVHSIGAARWDWPRIERIGIVNRALHSAGISSAVEMTSKGALAEQLIEHAVTRHGLAEQADLVEFTVRGLSTHPRFDEHPQVACAIKATGDPIESSSLSDRFALIEEHVWEALRHPVNSSTGHQL